MIITFLCEPRTGSSNLLFWFNQSLNFSTLFEPINNPDYRKFSSHAIINDKNDIQTWTYSKEHLVIKEICEPCKNYSNLLLNSDRIILLYRENYVDQIESWLSAHNNKDWGISYIYDKAKLIDKDYRFLTEIKYEMSKYKDFGFFRVSYEELYYKNGIQKIIDYIGLDELKNLKFPYGKKYRKDKTII
jgi:hypothetical protein